MTENTSGLSEVGRYSQMSDANERALVILAMGLGYWMFKEADDFVLCVEVRHLVKVSRELEKFELENPRRVRVSERITPARSSVSLFVFVWMMSLFFLVQLNQPESWTNKGTASSEAILHQGEFWRTITALTLHADLEHLCANLAAGLLFARFLLPILGTGLTWSSILFAGALGNYLNAWGYRETPHFSIGASTAVFGALGLLVACQTLFLLREDRRIRHWEMILPLGAGLALLAWLGRGDAQTDYMAHFWGLTAGIIIGAVLIRFKLNDRLLSGWQKILAVLAVAVPLGAWALI